MKTKFETNVAADIPKTKMSKEPGLPWKINNSDLEQVGSIEEAYKDVVAGAPPLKVRAIFLVLLLVTVFITTVYYVSVMIMENEKTLAGIKEKELAVSALQTNMEKLKGEKEILNSGVTQLEKKVKDLNAQKELFTTVIESLSKKGEEPSKDAMLPPAAENMNAKP